MDLEKEIWIHIYQQLIYHHNFEAVNEDFWNSFKLANCCQHTIEDLKQYYESAMKNNLHKMKLDGWIILDLYKYMKIPISNIVQPEIEENFKVVIKLDEQRMMVDYDFVQTTPVNPKHPTLSKRKATNRTIQRRKSFTISDKVQMAEYLFEKMVKAEEEGETISPRGNSIWRNYRCDVNGGRGVYNYQSHFTRQMTKYLYTLPMNREKILRMYHGFRIEVNAKMRQKIAKLLKVKLDIRENMIVGWKVVEGGEGKEEKEEEKEDDDNDDEEDDDEEQEEDEEEDGSGSD
ncbi:unnamed protein product [Caenorhabditis angaria]|uniref:SPK domain-containing protein n=1 Tax=Caenorhabditis angaria TaxID=860376 RepID=A0A9P1N100_9PELO|nr:unnamed protein product [Caenorhabditis angaria]